MKFLLFFIGLVLAIMFGAKFLLWLMSSKRKKNPKSEPHRKGIFGNIPVEPLFMSSKNIWGWQQKTDEQKNKLRRDLEVFLEYGENETLMSFLKDYFSIGSKIIDIKWFTGIRTHGSGEIDFLVKKPDNEIRIWGLHFDLKTSEFKTRKNHFYKSGKEEYYYLKNRKTRKNQNEPIKSKKLKEK